MIFCSFRNSRDTERKKPTWEARAKKASKRATKEDQWEAKESRRAASKKAAKLREDQRVLKMAAREDQWAAKETLWEASTRAACRKAATEKTNRRRTGTTRVTPWATKRRVATKPSPTLASTNRPRKIKPSSTTSRKFSNSSRASTSLLSNDTMPSPREKTSTISSRPSR